MFPLSERGEDPEQFRYVGAFADESGESGKARYDGGPSASSSVDRAPPSGGGSRGFESLLARFLAVERPGSLRGAGDAPGTNLMLAGGLSDDAYRALLDLDWESVRGGMLMWHPDAREWFDPNRRDR